MKFTFLSHSTFILKVHEKNILVDPFLSENPFFCKKQFSWKKYIVEPIDYILVTHAHYDHVCDVELFHKIYPNSLVISNYEISNFFEKKGIKTYGVNYGSFISFPFGKLKYVWALHSSSFVNGIYGGNPGGFLLHTDEGNIYVSGDTSLMYDMKIIPTFGKLKYSILPIGGRFTMDVEEAIIASDFLHCEKIIGVHYNTFDSIQIDEKNAIKSFYQKGKELIILNIGHSVHI
ncbi:metal-dependent hydrolase [Blattabacterium cuenoti]|uniref:metal-dependent hydrolase n=1 Tax=Blattabacterium cuenoti TaxID=1653831 RepID=UPI00163C5F63|nr:metal-dependent hydrolase [Blattabacterium cuenoti]